MEVMQGPELRQRRPAREERSRSLDSRLSLAHPRLREASARRRARAQRKDALNRCVDGRAFTALMAVATLYALFGDDFRVAALPKAVDPVFEWLSSAVFFLFIIEIGLNAYGKPGYVAAPCCDAETRLRRGVVRSLRFGSFYFWLDAIATVSLVAEIPWIVSVDSSHSRTDASIQTARGARAVRIIRVARLARFARLAKLYRYYLTSSGGQRHDASGGGDDQQRTLKSRVGMRMTDLATRRIIVGILLMMGVIPLLLPLEVDRSFGVGTDFVHALAVAATADPSVAPARDAAVRSMRSHLPSLRLLELNGTTVIRGGGVGNVRAADVLEIDRVSNQPPFVTRAVFALGAEASASAAWSLGLMAFVMTALVLGSVLFNADVTRIVLLPLESLLDAVAAISRDPLSVPSHEAPPLPSWLPRGFGRPPEEPDAARSDSRTGSRILSTVPAAAAAAAADLISATRRRSFTLAFGSSSTGSTTTSSGGGGGGAEDAGAEAEPLVDPSLHCGSLPGPRVLPEPSGRFRPGFETTLLLRALHHVHRFLRIGFGEAGAGVVASAAAAHGGGEVDLRAQGRLRKVLFGCVHFPGLAAAADAAQGEVAPLIARLTAATHTIARAYGGVVLRNGADSILLAWPHQGVRAALASCPEGRDAGSSRQAAAGSSASVRPSSAQDPFPAGFDDAWSGHAASLRQRVRGAHVSIDAMGTAMPGEAAAMGRRCEHAAIAMIKIVVETATDTSLTALSPTAAALLRAQRRCGTRMRASTALHYGWAVEGVYGSPHSVTGTYLSPHAALCEALSRRCAHYGASLLLSDAAHTLLPARAQGLCRPVDVVAPRFQGDLPFPAMPSAAHAARAAPPTPPPAARSSSAATMGQGPGTGSEPHHPRPGAVAASIAAQTLNRPPPLEITCPPPVASARARVVYALDVDETALATLHAFAAARHLHGRAAHILARTLDSGFVESDGGGGARQEAAGAAGGEVSGDPSSGGAATGLRPLARKVSADLSTPTVSPALGPRESARDSPSSTPARGAKSWRSVGAYRLARALDADSRARGLPWLLFAHLRAQAVAATVPGHASDGPGAEQRHGVESPVQTPMQTSAPRHSTGLAPSSSSSPSTSSSPASSTATTARLASADHHHLLLPPPHGGSESTRATARRSLQQSPSCPPAAIALLDRAQWDGEARARAAAAAQPLLWYWHAPPAMPTMTAAEWTEVMDRHGGSETPPDRALLLELLALPDRLRDPRRAAGARRMSEGETPRPKFASQGLFSLLPPYPSERDPWQWDTALLLAVGSTRAAKRRAPFSAVLAHYAAGRWRDAAWELARTPALSRRRRRASSASEGEQIGQTTGQTGQTTGQTEEAVLTELRAVAGGDGSDRPAQLLAQRLLAAPWDGEGQPPRPTVLCVDT